MNFVWAVVCPLVAACGGDMHTSAAAGAPSPTVPAELQVPGGTAPKLHLFGRGVQIYSCAATPMGGYAWTFSAPEAELFDDKQTQQGKHYGGPTWELNDGSKVVGKVLANVTAPAADAVPWLLLQVVSNSGTGVLADAQYIQRLDTVGGKAPASGCDATTAGQEARVAYTADYYFW
jgi:hypothetical protein